MTALNQPSEEVESLLELCSTSASPENDRPEMPRVFQVTIWVEGRDIGDFKKIRACVTKQIGHNRLGSVIEGANWGPFEGSWYGAFFGRMNREMTGEQFQWGLWQVVHDFWGRFLFRLEASRRALLIVGTVAIGMTGDHEAKQGPSFSYFFSVPASLARDIMTPGTTLNPSDQFKKLLPTDTSPQPKWVPPTRRPTDPMGDPAAKAATRLGVVATVELRWQALCSTNAS